VLCVMKPRRMSATKDLAVARVRFRGFRGFRRFKGSLTISPT